MYIRSKPLLILFCLISAQAFAASVTWIDGVSPPIGWTVDPNHPGPSDIVTFSGPLDFIYSSSCNARGSLGGTPQITVDTLNKEVRLSFQGPAPTQCAAIWAPVSGLHGDFGPLAPGYWTFRSTSPQIPFNIPFLVGTPSSTYYVDQDAPGPVHNGTNWYWAFSTLQDALAAAVPGDTILVAEGIYTPDQGGAEIPGDQTASFHLQDGMTLKGGHAGFGSFSPDAYDPKTYVTELSGDLAGNDLYGLLNTEENGYHVVTAMSPTGGTEITLQGVSILNGRATAHAPHQMGGGLLIMDADVVMSDSLFYGNKAAFGGAVAIDSGSLTLVNSRVSGNTALLYGAGFYTLESTVTLTNCLVTGNSGSEQAFAVGSVLYGLNSNTYIHSSTLTDNVPEDGEVITSLGWLYPPTHELVVNNSILYNGNNVLYTSHPSTTEVSYSDVQGGWSGAGPGNIDADPLFVATGNWSYEGEWIPGDYHLKSGSPCIDQANAILLPADVTDLNLNSNTVEPLPLDLDGLPRVQGIQTDMGVYETFAPVGPPVPPVPPVHEDWIVFDSYNITDTPTVPSLNVDVSVSFTIHVNISASQEELDLAISATSAAGGDWTATYVPDPGILTPGTYPITIQILGEHLDMSQLTMGVQATLAKVNLLYRVVQP